MIVLDTHAWVWWSGEPEKISTRARRAIDEAAEIGVCAISCWEVATLVRQGRLGFDRDLRLWIRQALALPRVELLPITAEVAIQAGELDPFHGDPADRLIAATAIVSRSSLVSKDGRMRDAKHVACVW